MTHQVAICQPHYVPWIGYFEMLDRVDEFLFLDDVDVIQRDWKTRNRIRKQRDGDETKWLSVPLEHGSRRLTPIDEARIGGDGTWRRRHLDAFAAVYARAPFFEHAAELFEGGLARQATTLADLNIGLIADLSAYLGIDTPTRRASALGAAGRKTDKLVALCSLVGAQAYLANNGSAGYLEAARFEAGGMRVAYQDYGHPAYAQTSAGAALPFLSHLSVLDLIANHGPDSLAILREGRPISAA